MGDAVGQKNLRKKPIQEHPLRDFARGGGSLSQIGCNSSSPGLTGLKNVSGTDGDWASGLRTDWDGFERCVSYDHRANPNEVEPPKHGAHR